MAEDEVGHAEESLRRFPARRWLRLPVDVRTPWLISPVMLQLPVLQPIVSASQLPLLDAGTNRVQPAASPLTPGVSFAEERVYLG